MKRQVINHTCVYCKKPFEANRSTARYCSGTCKTYASQERTGRRKPFAVSGLPQIASPEEFQKRAAEIEAQINALTDARKKMIEQLEKAEDKKKRIDLELKRVGMEEAETRSLNDQKAKANNKMAELENSLDRMLFEKVRLQQLDFDLHLPKIWANAEVNGKDIGLFAQKRVRYPFEKLRTARDLPALGSPARPFILYVCEGNPDYEGQIEVVMRLAGEVAAFGDAPILVVVDRQIMANGFESYLRENGLSRENVTLKFAENRADIEAAFERNEYEFAVFPDLSVFNLDYDFFQNLTKKHPRTSIFCASEKRLNDFVNRNRLNVRLETGWEEMGWGGILVTPHSSVMLLP